MRISFALALSLLLAASLLAQAPPRNGRRSQPKDAPEQPAAADPAPTPHSLLERSRSIVQDLPVEQRANLLASLATSAARLDAKLGRELATELFNLSAQLTDPVAHGAAQLAAVRAMTINADDLHTALELFHRMDGVDPAQLSPGQRDPRLQAARSLFPALMGDDFDRRFGGPRRPPQSDNAGQARRGGWAEPDPEQIKKQAKAFTTVLEEAQRLQPAGLYPYFAVVQVASGLPSDKEHDPLADAVVDAEQAFRQSPRSLQGNEEFRAMLDAYWNRVPRDLAQTALRDLANNMIALGDQGSTSVQTYGPNGRQTVDLKSASDASLLELLPIMRELDPQLLEKLQSERPDLARAVDQVGNNNIVSASGISTPRGSNVGTGPYPGAMGRGPLNRATMAGLRNAAQQNPQQAMAMAGALTDPSQASVAYAVVAGNLANNDPKAAADALQKAQDTADKITDKTAQLQAELSLANSAARLNNELALREILVRAFAIGNDLLREELDAQPDQEPSPNQLQRLVSLGMRQVPDVTLSLIEQVSVPIVKARLLINAATMIQQKRPNVRAAAEVKNQ